MLFNWKDNQKPTTSNVYEHELCHIELLKLKWRLNYINMNLCLKLLSYYYYLFRIKDDGYTIV